MKLFEKKSIVGIFRGFSQGGLEFHAELVLPYKNSFQSIPMHGQFLLIQLESEEEAVLGRITALSSEGRLASSSGEDYGIRAIADDRKIPEDLREQYLKYRVEIRVLGILRIVDGKIVFAASHRRLPHVGSKVAFLSEEILKEVTSHNSDGIDLGFFTLGEFVYCGDDRRITPDTWMKIQSPAIIPKFAIRNLVSRRSFVFARAGFGKSNLNKLLFSSLYKETPYIEKQKGSKTPVGTVIFDPEGEYYWPDVNNRPGLCDVPELEDKIIIFTRKTGPSQFYDSFKAGDIKLDIRRLKPSDVISIAMPPEKQSQQNIRKLMSLNDENWRKLVDEIYAHKNLSDDVIIKELLHLKPTSESDAEMVAARSNMTIIVNMLHDPSSLMLDMLLTALKAGKICIVDVSQLRGEQSLILSGIILQKIFDYNQERFTEAVPQTIPTLAVIEEAQSVLGEHGGSRPYITWVKEGRKYDLGAVLITQQPGSIATEILSQGDNWFVFHLLSAADLQSLKRANAHFSDDLLSTLLNEPLVGHGIFWSSVSGKSYPIPIRILPFEEMYTARDPKYNKPAANTVAVQLRKQFKDAIAATVSAASPKEKTIKPSDESVPKKTEPELPISENGEEGVDVLETYITQAIAAMKTNVLLIDETTQKGKPWMGIQVAFETALPTVLDTKERRDIAFKNMRRALNEVFGVEKWGTERRPKKDGSGKEVTYVIIKK